MFHPTLYIKPVEPVKPDTEDSDSDDCDVVCEKASDWTPNAESWNITFIRKPKPVAAKPVEPDTEDSDSDDCDDCDVVCEKASDWTPNAEIWDITFIPKKPKPVAATPVTEVSVPTPCSHINSWNQLVASTGNGVDVDDRFEAFQFGNETSATKAQNLALEPGVWHPNQRATMVSVKSLMNDA